MTAAPLTPEEERELRGVLEALANREIAHGPWDCTNFNDLTPHEIEWCRAVSPEVVLRMIARVRALEVEAGHHDHWHAFGARVWRWLAENWDTEDGWELAEIAVLSGLAEHVKYDPDKHGECEAEPGDDIIYPLRGDPAFAALAESGANLTPPDTESSTAPERRQIDTSADITA